MDVVKLRIANILKMEAKEQDVEVKGWVRTKRDSKDFAFLEINDGSSMKGIQVFVDKAANSIPEIEKKLHEITTGSSIIVNGTLVASPGENQSMEVRAKSIDITGSAPSDYPMQKKRHSFEYLREIAHLRPRTNTFGAVTRVRNCLSYAVHRFFQERDFLYIHTPIITASDAEGAGEMFQVTTLPFEKLLAAGQKIDYKEDFFGKKASLTVSGQLEAEIYATAMTNVYTFGPTFRAENSNTSRHLAEFWMIEPEMAFCDIEGDMNLAEEFIKYILKAVITECPEDMEFFTSRIEKGVLETLEQVVQSDFVRITYTDAIDELKKAPKEFDFPVRWGVDLQSEHEKFLTEEIYKKPVIVTDYPKEIKAFYMKLNDDEKTVRAMDVLVPRLGEIIGGSERESRLDVLEAKMKTQGLDPKIYWWYLDLRKYGTVPHAGFGLGFERLIQYVTGMQNIRDVIPFPRTVKNAEF